MGKIKMKKEKSSLWGINILFGTATVIILLFTFFYWGNYQEAIRIQEKLVNKKQHGKLEVYVNVFSDRIENSIKVLNFIKDEVVSKYISREKIKMKLKRCLDFI